MAKPATSTKPARKTKAKTKADDPVIFESRDAEPFQFEIMKIRATRNFSSNRIEWEVPVDKVELFMKHPHVTCGRVRVKA